MGDHAGGTAPLSRTTGALWDRFAHWERLPARLALVALAVILISSMLAPINAGKSTLNTRGFVENIVSEEGPGRGRDDDLALYDKATERIARGENYYDFIAEEHRGADYPLRPGLAVRLPTLAYLNAWLGTAGQLAASIALLIAAIWAWWRRLREEPGGRQKLALAMSFLVLGLSLGLNRYFFALHELWSGMLLALAFALHRPLVGKWGASLAVAALALAIREHALPFILLMAALAFNRRSWREGAAWSALALAFLGLLALHLNIVAGHVLPTDRTGADWLAMRGFSGWLSNVVLTSNLRFLPHWLAGPLVVLAIFGWTGWRTPAGEFGTFLYSGYGVAFMIAGRPDNYYWGFMVSPAIFAGLAFAPMALRSLLRTAFAPAPAHARPAN
jgi:hypothetical protein